MFILLSLAFVSDGIGAISLCCLASHVVFAYGWLVTVVSKYLSACTIRIVVISGTSFNHIIRTVNIMYTKLREYDYTYSTQMLHCNHLDC